VKDNTATALAADDFGRLRVREIIQRVASLITGRRDDLLSFTDVKDILRPSDESYRGIRPVRIDSIVGSEGRYNDFTRSFLPRHRHMRGRWTRVGAARYEEIGLPAIRLYEIGGAYFVRDGNHRVSVAKTAGVEFIDAEVTSLSTYFTITPDMTSTSGSGSTPSRTPTTFCAAKSCVSPRQAATTSCSHRSRSGAAARRSPRAPRSRSPRRSSPGTARHTSPSSSSSAAKGCS